MLADDQIVLPTRYELRGRLGAGGMGIVYRAFDRERRIEVALKTLRYQEARALYRFKREFRALTDVSHRNLITLYELQATESCWFFTMELISGVDLRNYLRGSVKSQSPAPPIETLDTLMASTLTMKTLNPGTPTEAAPRMVSVMTADVDYDQLRAAFRQLAEGVCALHQSGHLHRDLKPSNVLVDEDGRLIILDFGIITELAAHRRAPVGGSIVGTPAYMAPEQAAGKPALTASDWYAVGVMLYEALTGNRPFLGDSATVLASKQEAAAAAPREAKASIPADLDALCAGLLERRPAMRPTGREVVAALGGSAPDNRNPRGMLLAGGSAFVGRRAELDILHSAFADIRRGRGSILYVTGESGLGKTALVQHFVDELERSQNALVLRGRCYERESVPYKAVDGLLDALSRRLLELSSEQLARLLPPDVWLLALLFPVLQRIEGVAAAKPLVEVTMEPREIRRGAFVALRALMTALASQQPLVLFIDDLQWGDVDSAHLLDALMRGSNAPALLLIGCYREDETARSPLLQSFERPDSCLSPGGGAHLLELAPLSTQNSQELAHALLGGQHRLAETVAREGRGHPLFVHALAGFLADADGRNDGAAHRPELSVEHILASQAAELPANARALLELVAIAGKPTRQMLVRRAADIDPAEHAASVQLLRTARLVRTSGPRDSDVIECYHDRVRVTIAAAMDAPLRRRYHACLASELAAAPTPDALTLAQHYLAAGDTSLAAHYSRHAGDQAAAALAFERAIQAYRLAIELGKPTDISALDLRIALANALRNAGRGKEAAEAFLDAAVLATPGNAIELRRSASEEFLCCGYMNEGIASLETVLAQVGMRLPRTAWSSLPAALFARVRLRLRGLEHRERDDADLRVEERLRIDVCRSAATGLSMVTPGRASVFGTRTVLAALSAGEPHRLVRALAVEAGLRAAEGRRGQRRVRRLLLSTRAIATRLEIPYAMALADCMEAILAYQRGEFRRCLERATVVQQRLRSECTGVSWELRSMQFFRLNSMMFLGDLKQLASAAPQGLQEASDAGDLFASTMLRATVMPALHFAADDPQAARSEVNDAMARWPHTGRDLQHMLAQFALMQADLYEGKGHAVLAAWPALRRDLVRSLLAFVPGMRSYAVFLRGSAALIAAGGDQQRRKQLLCLAARSGKRLRRSDASYAAMGRILEAGTAHLRGQPELTMHLLADSTKQLERAELTHYAAATRHVQGVLLGGDTGGVLVARSRRELAVGGARNVARAGALLTPGFGELWW